MNFRWIADNQNGSSKDFVGTAGGVQWQFNMTAGTQYFWSNAVIGICNYHTDTCGKHGN